METRPDPASVTSAAELRRWYWLKTELEQLARQLGMSSRGGGRGGGGGKAELTERLAELLTARAAEPVGPTASPGQAAPQPAGRARPAASRPPRRPTSPSGELADGTVIAAGQRCSQNLRAFFTARIGPGFRFDAEMREFIAAGEGRTLGEAVDHWYASRSAAPRDIAPQFELNRFLRDWHRDHPGQSRSAALAAWRDHRSLPREEVPATGR